MIRFEFIISSWSTIKDPLAIPSRSIDPCVALISPNSFLLSSTARYISPPHRSRSRTNPVIFFFFIDFRRSSFILALSPSPPPPDPPPLRLPFLPIQRETKQVVGMLGNHRLSASSQSRLDRIGHSRIGGRRPEATHIDCSINALRYIACVIL